MEVGVDLANNWCGKKIFGKNVTVKTTKKLYPLYFFDTCIFVKPFYIETRKRAIAKALHLEGHSDFAPVDLAYY